MTLVINELPTDFNRILVKSTTDENAIIRVKRDTNTAEAQLLHILHALDYKVVLERDLDTVTIISKLNLRALDRNLKDFATTITMSNSKAVLSENLIKELKVLFSLSYLRKD